MIRPATLADVLPILEQAQRFNDRYYTVPLDIKKALNWITYVIEDGVALVSDKGGFIGGIKVTDPARNWDVLVEVCWYSEDRTGAYLLKAFNAAGIELGVDEVRMTTLTASPPIAEHMLNRLGYKPMEVSYSLIL